MNKIRIIFILFSLLIVIESVAQTQTDWSPVVWRATNDTLSVTMSYDDSIPAVERYMLFSVVKSLSPDSSQLLWSINENDSMMYGVFTDGSYNKHSGFIHKQTNLDFSQWKVFVYQQGCATDTNKQYSLHIGALDSVPSNIMIPEYLFFSSTMKPKQKMAIQTYLAIKYGITLDYAPYLTGEYDTIWNPKTEEKYYHRVIGIGYDTISTLLQTESKSACPNPITLYDYSISSGGYTLCGDNDKTLEWISYEYGGFRVDRSWRVRSNQPPFVLSFDPTILQHADTIVLAILDNDNQIISNTLPDSIDMFGKLYFTMDSNAADFTFWTNEISNSQTKRKRATNNNQDGRDVVQISYLQNVGGIEFASQGILTPDLYKMYDSTGRLVSDAPVVFGSARISSNNLPAGVYHVEALCNNVVIGYTKIIIL